MKNVFISICIFIFLFASCKHENNISVRSISLDLNNISKNDFKKIFSRIEILPLETIDSSIIGGINGAKLLYVPDKYYIIVDARRIINVFDQNGIFIANSSKCMGKGPQEYYIFQDLTYNPYSNLINILDAYGNIISYDIEFNFVSKVKVKSDDGRYRCIYALDEHLFALMYDRNTYSFYLYDAKKDEIVKEVFYNGSIANISSVVNPFILSDSKIYFTPPNINYYTFIYDSMTEKLNDFIYFDTNGEGVEKDNVIFKEKDPAKVGRYLVGECPKFVRMNCFFNDEYAVTLFVKQQEQFVNFCNLKTGENSTHRRKGEGTVSIPNFITIDGNMLVAIYSPDLIDEFVDFDLVKNKDILQNRTEDDNPYVLKYFFK